MEYLNDEESSNGFELFKMKSSNINDLKNTNKTPNNKDFEVNQNNINNIIKL